MALRRQTGVVRTMAVAVTSIVPMMKGKKPNSPLIGAQDDEKRRWRIDSLTRIGLDLINKLKAIRNAIEFAKATANSIDLAARLSLTLLQRNLLVNPRTNIRCLYPGPSGNYPRPFLPL
jgi:hypothetical protein